MTRRRRTRSVVSEGSECSAVDQQDTRTGILDTSGSFSCCFHSAAGADVARFAQFSVLVFTDRFLRDPHIWPPAVA